jgi:hypothetical protein
MKIGVVRKARANEIGQDGLFKEYDEAKHL